MYKPETMLSASLRRLKQTTQIKKLYSDKIFFQEFKYNGTPEHFLKRCEDSSIRKRYSPVCEILSTHFYALNLPYQKGFLLCGTDQHFQPLFKNTVFPQQFQCKDEIYVWNIKELKDLHDFYRELA